MFRINKTSYPILIENYEFRFKKNDLIENLNNENIKTIKEDKELKVKPENLNNENIKTIKEDKELTIKQLQSKQQDNEIAYLKLLKGEADNQMGPLTQKIKNETKQNYKILSVLDQINERSIVNQTQNSQLVLPLLESVFGVLFTQFIMNLYALDDNKTIDGRDLNNLDRLVYDKALILGIFNSIERIAYQYVSSSQFNTLLINNFIDSLNVPISQLITVFSRNHPLNIAHICINSLLIFGTFIVAQFDMIDKIKKDIQFFVNPKQYDIILKTQIDIKLHTFDSFLQSFNNYFSLRNNNVLFTISNKPKFKQDEYKRDQTTNEEILSKPDIAKLQPELYKLLLIGIFSNFIKNYVGQQVLHTFSFRNQVDLQFDTIFYLGNLQGVVFIGLIFIIMLQGSIQSNVKKFTDSFNVHLQGIWTNDLHQMRLSQMTYISSIFEIMTRFIQNKLLKKSLQMSELSKIPVYAINIFVSMNTDLYDIKATSLNVVNIIGSVFILFAEGFNIAYEKQIYKNQNLDQDSIQYMYDYNQSKDTDLLQSMPFFKIKNIDQDQQILN